MTWLSKSRALRLFAILTAATIWIATGSTAQAARLRPFVEIIGPLVHLSDLFSGLDAGQDVQLGEAPAPGSQVIIRSAQLSAIADQFGVSWDGSREGVSTIILRKGRQIDLAGVTSKLHAALTSAGVDANSIVTLDRFAVPTVDENAIIAVEAPDVDTTHRHFRAVLKATCGADQILAINLTGTIETAVSVVVAVHGIKAGEIITDNDLTLATFAESKVPANPISRIEEAVGQEARVSLTGAVPIAAAMLRRADLVHKGAPVAIHLAESGIDIAAQGVALGSGALDDRVPVLNPSSHAVLFGWVIGDSEVRVDPATRPTTPQPNLFSYGVVSR